MGELFTVLVIFFWNSELVLGLCRYCSLEWILGVKSDWKFCFLFLITYELKIKDLMDRTVLESLKKFFGGRFYFFCEPLRCQI